MNARLLIGCVLLVASALPARAQEPQYDHPLFTGPAHEAPEPVHDLEHLRLALRLDFEARAVTAEAMLRVRPLTSTPSPLVLMAPGWRVDSVAAAPPGGAARHIPSSRDAAGDLILHVDSLVLGEGDGMPYWGPFELYLSYRVTPRRGLYLLPADETDAAPQAWTLGLPAAAPYWLPVPEAPGDLFTAEVSVTVPTGLRAFSNGQHLGEEDEGEGRTTFHFVERHPLAARHLYVTAGAFATEASEADVADGRRVPLIRAGPLEQSDDLTRTLEATPEIIRFLSGRLRTPFPWPRFDQAAVRHLPYSAQEHAGGVTYADRLIQDERSALDHDVTPILAHSLAHQWFGAAVVPAYWTEDWFSEGVATYLAARYLAETQGEEALQLTLQRYARAYLDEAAVYRRPLVWDRWEDPADLLDAHAYRKGAWVFHMLYDRLGERAFWGGLREVLRRHAHRPVYTEDVMEAMASSAGMPLDGFFDQWVYGAGHPVLEVSYRHDADAEMLLLDLRQVQEGYLVPGAFSLEMDAVVHTLAGTERFDIALDAREATLEVPLDMPPRFVVLDPEQTVLADVRVAQPATAWVAQLRYAEAATARLAAAYALRDHRDDPALLIALRSALDAETVADVRAAVVETLGRMPASDAVLRTLLPAASDGDPAVREAAMRALGSYAGSDEAAAAAQAAAEGEPSYRVQAEAVRTLARLGAPSALGIAQAALVTPSYRELVRQAGFDALALLRVPATQGLALALPYAAPGQPDAVRAAALAYLARIAPDAGGALAPLLQGLDDPLPQVRLAAVRAIGTLQSDRLREALVTRQGKESYPDVLRALEAALRAYR